MAVSFIGGGDRSTLKKPQVTDKLYEDFVWLNNLVFCSSYSVHTLFRKTHLGDTLVLLKKILLKIYLIKMSFLLHL